MSIQHKTIFLDNKNIPLSLPLTREIKRICPDESFPLLEDPLKEQKTLMIGMFVLRPFRQTWQTPEEEKYPGESLFETEDWIYNIDSASGGGFIAGGNLMDGFRLGLQYGISDAVLVGSSTVVNDGIPSRKNGDGYIWMPYNCASWPNLKLAVPDMMAIIREQREIFRKKGYASRRDYPAQIVVSRSGKSAAGKILSARIFHDTLPDGAPMESYILTSQSGAEELKKEAETLGMTDRINKILITHSSAGKPEEIDLKTLPERLFREYDIRIANHDGGALVLKAFLQAGIIPQCNFTFCRTSVTETIDKNRELPKEELDRIRAGLDRTARKMFSEERGRMPRMLKVRQLIQDEKDEAMVVVLDSRDVRDF